MTTQGQTSANASENNIVQEKQALDSVCKELGVIDIKYLPSPKESAHVSISDLAKHATTMLRNYKKYLNGDKASSKIEEVFID
ncbi:MAG TPA: hypothetical protein VLF89_04070 [Candidatus Saccharimonadales bacterium]|nr:hypothetical protein [Candidatus Saccharimonadales bacterium]